jgi:O-antigen/teichoic acid export membrane protein
VYQKLTSVLALVRLTPFDVQTEQGRSNERYRKAIWSILANVLSRAFGVALTLLSVSLTLPYLGIERFGIWMTVASFAGLLTFLDLGVGNALTNHVATRAAKDNPALLRQTISGGLGFLALIGLCIGLVLWLVAAHLPWGSILKVEQDDLLTEARLAAMCFGVLFGITVFTSGIQNVFVGLQRSYVGHIVSGFSSLVACLFLWLATAAHQGITILLAIIMGPPVLAGLILLTVLTMQGQFTLRGIVGLVGLESKNLYGAGGLFFLLQIGTMVGWGMDTVLISSTLGVAQVAIFSIVQRLFQLTTQPLSIFNAPLWGAYADANSRNDRAFIRKTLKISLVGTLVIVFILASGIFLSHSWLIEKWSQSNIFAPIAFVAAYALWSVIQSFGNAFGIFLNGTGIIKQQVKAVTLFIIIAFPAKIIMTEYFNLVGLMLATVIAYVVSHTYIYCYLHLDDIKKKIK